MSGRFEISGWYGKLPGSGDFASRGLDAAVQQRVESWITSGLVQLRHRLPDWSYAFAQSPTWAAILPRGVLSDASTWCCLVPSADRVGRLFPLVVLQSFVGSADQAADLINANRWYANTAALINDAQANAMSIETFDEAFLNLRIDRRAATVSAASAAESAAGGDIFAVLGETQSNVITLNAPTAAIKPAPADAFESSWPELANLFDPSGTRSFWWTLGTPISKRLGHEGNLTPHLFITLFTTAQRGSSPHLIERS